MPSRRRTLSVVGTLTLAGLAGCAGTLDGGGPGENGDQNSTAEDSSDDGVEESNDETAPEEGDATDESADGDSGEEPEDESGNGNENENETESENDDTTPDETFLTVSSGDREIDAVRYEQVESASEPATIDGQHVLPVVLTDEGADSFREALGETGAMESPADAEVTAYQGGEAVHSRQLSEELIATAEASDFAGPFNVPLESREQADEIYEAIDTDEE
ncbi:hypothetical protein [Halomontanus rarus]|uniref:hypothetical protein n=1 Tax=Halomontanus rarus TaxID=3034020 RepID=UPI001A99B2C6